MGKKPARAKSTPNPLAHVLEPQWRHELCAAIKARTLVHLRYKTELAFRTFAPFAVFKSTAGKTLVYGIQILNPLQPLDQNEPHNFEVGEISSLSRTLDHFTPDSRFSSFDKKYGNGVICAIDRG